jgi:hypothetical protein
MALGKESIITVNGHQLTDAESMTIRVALQSFAMDMSTIDTLCDLGRTNPFLRAAIRVNQS